MSFIKSIIKIIIPKGHLRKVKDTYLILRSVFYIGNGFYCPCCEGTFRKFLSLKNYPGKFIMCPRCEFAYLNALYSTPGTVGFKLMYAQLGLYPEILTYLMRHRVRVVHLVRRNHLDVVLSYAVKARLGRAHLLLGQAAPDDMRVELDTKNLVSQLEWLQKRQSMARKLLSWCRLPHLDVAYEDLLRDQAHFHLIQNFISIKPTEHMPQSTLVKIRREGQREVISNYAQVKEVLANSKFAGLLE